MKKIILMSPGAYDWRIDGIYDTKEQLLETLKIDWGCDDLTMEEMEDPDWQDNHDTKIIEGNYYPQT